MGAKIGVAGLFGTLTLIIRFLLSSLLMELSWMLLSAFFEATRPLNVRCSWMCTESQKLIVISPRK